MSDPEVPHNTNADEQFQERTTDTEPKHEEVSEETSENVASSREVESVQNTTENIENVGDSSNTDKQETSDVKPPETDTNVEGIETVNVNKTVEEKNVTDSNDISVDDTMEPITSNRTEKQLNVESAVEINTGDNPDNINSNANTTAIADPPSLNTGDTADMVDTNADNTVVAEPASDPSSSNTVDVNSTDIPTITKNDAEDGEEKSENAVEVDEEVKKETVKKNLSPYQTDLADFDPDAPQKCPDNLSTDELNKNESNKENLDQNESKDGGTPTEVKFKNPIEGQSKKLPTEEEELGIYEDIADLGGLSDTEEARKTPRKSKPSSGVQLPPVNGSGPLMPEYAYIDRPESGLEGLGYDQPGHVSWDTNDPNFSVSMTTHRYYSGIRGKAVTPASHYSAESR